MLAIRPEKSMLMRRLFEPTVIPFTVFDEIKPKAVRAGALTRCERWSSWTRSWQF
jgi:hypothetical protein